MPSLIGTGQDQVPTNGLLGSMAFVDAEAATFQLSGDATANLDPVTLQQLNTEKYGRLLNVKVLTGSGTYTPTAGTKSIIVELQGDGGGASVVPATTATQIGVSVAGQTGGYLKCRVTSGFSSVAYVVGTGGAGGTTANGSPGDGTTLTLSFGGLFAAPGNGGTYTAALANNVATTKTGGTASIFTNTVPANAALTVIENTQPSIIDDTLINLSGMTGVSVPPPGKFGRKIGATFITSSETTIGGLKGFGLGGVGKTRVNFTGSTANGDAGSAGTIIIYEYA